MVGQFIIMFAKDQIKERINNLKKFVVRTGFASIGGNKGCVAIRFQIDNTAFAFLNVHLASGQYSNSERMESLRQIYNDTFNEFSVCNTQEKCYHDYKCIFGDFNFRLDLQYDEAIELISQKNYKQLQMHDSLDKSKQNCKIL